jgi:hypothetical protein
MINIDYIETAGPRKNENVCNVDYLARGYAIGENIS